MDSQRRWRQTIHGHARVRRVELADILRGGGGWRWRTKRIWKEVIVIWNWRRGGVRLMETVRWHDVVVQVGVGILRRLHVQCSSCRRRLSQMKGKRRGASHDHQLLGRL